MVYEIHIINRFLQEQLAHRSFDTVTAIEAARWLGEAGLLNDSADRPGLPLRRLLRAGMILGARQEGNGRWSIERLDTRAALPRRGQLGADSTSARDNSTKRSPTGASQRDEGYVLDLCDELLGRVALRQHRFDFLRGDAGHRLPVDAYYPDLQLVIEYREPQHSQPFPFFDKPHRLTVSGVHRGEQRLLYDERRRVVLSQHGIVLVELSYDELTHTTRGRLSRDRREDLRVLRRKLAAWLNGGEIER